MMDATFAQWILGQVGVGGIAALALYLLNKAHQDARQRERDCADGQRTDKTELIRVVTEAARATAGLEAAIARLEAAIAALVHDRPRNTATDR